MTYHRYTNTSNPMSDWGHAMFVDNADDTAYCYGEHHWTFDGKGAERIENLYAAITEAWNNQEDWERLQDLGGDDDLSALTAEEVCRELNPEDIVDSARGYDNDLSCWLWNNVLEPKGIMAVLTADGAIVYDETMIEEA